MDFRHPHRSEHFRANAAAQRRDPATVSSVTFGEVNDLERELFTLPARHGGLGIVNPCTQSDQHFSISEELTLPLVAMILAQERILNAKELSNDQSDIRARQRTKAEEKHRQTLENIKEQAPLALKTAIEQACEKGASSWVTARPLRIYSTKDISAMPSTSAMAGNPDYFQRSAVAGLRST